MNLKKDKVTVSNSIYEIITLKSHNSVIKNQITSDTKYVFVGTNTQYHIEKEENKEDYSPASGYFYGGVDTFVYETIDELCNLSKNESLKLKKEALCKKLKERDIWGWEIIEQDIQEILRKYKISFLDTLEYETVFINSNGIKKRSAVTLDYDSFIESYNKNQSVILIPVSEQARCYLDETEKHTGLKFNISNLVLCFEPFIHSGGNYGIITDYYDTDDYFELAVLEYMDIR